MIQEKKKGEKIKIEFIRNKKRNAVEVEIEEEKRGGVFGSILGRRFPPVVLYKKGEDHYYSWGDYSKEMLKQFKEWPKNFDIYTKQKLEKLREISKKSKKLKRIKIIPIARYSWVQEV